MYCLFCVFVISVLRPWRRWTEEERAAVTQHLAEFMALRKVPCKNDCISCLNAEPILQSRTRKDIKNCVHNTIESLKRKKVLQ